MEISKGFQIEEPSVWVPRGATEAHLLELLSPHGLRKVTSGYYTISAKSLAGLGCEIGFHFTPKREGLLRELEFFRRSYPDQAKSFASFQEHLERAFGVPTSAEPGSDGFPTYGWSIGGVSVSHYVFDRFGPEEHVRIKW
jgi:hypothetical protein